MILVGQYDSPYVRRVAVSLLTLGFAFSRDARSVFGDFDALRAINPVGRIPSLVLDDGTALVDSAAILDWIDHLAGPARALLPTAQPARRDALHRIALATGAIDKAGQAAYERVLRPAEYRWPEWVARCRIQAAGALAALDALDWPAAPLDQAQITTACLVRYIRMAEPELLPPGRHPALEALAARCEALPAFVQTCPADYALPRG